ncbi:uncharacterized protein MYCFIDRAFT_87553 [Pseudocercospora fijiensis CIRAD86]|uniref:Prion-inhibition and propagation HeLo domain-containing protein n=1 Tax=Pseudocercospora fijiensis (strain CIRAD86) TaxID=383855 RepID=N1QBU5_PSEFD|nr:uncharacterized protein MYCFIDRAFT_87553 [Pseudocercospora fijiensis CIRAD86]EME88698.1 hypothetical protein MYCFIDRAFT_87553 [Pseudocercospora fijiensis CIRAD86]
MAVETIPVTELEWLIKDVNNHFMALYHDGAFTRSRALGQAQMRFEQWTKTPQVISPGPPVAAKKSLQRLCFDLEDALNVQDSTDLDRLAAQISVYLANLEQLQTPAVDATPHISDKDIPQSKTLKHQYVNNEASNTSKALYGDWIAKDYNGPFSEFSSVYRENKANDSAKVQYGDIYNGKSVFD